jgi:hypothetical protein
MSLVAIGRGPTLSPGEASLKSETCSLHAEAFAARSFCMVR